MLEALVLIAADLPVAGAVALGLATAATGVVFAAITAVACQLAAYARTANGIAAGVLGLAFLLRAVGDSSDRARAGCRGCRRSAGPSNCGRSPASAGGSWRSRRSPRRGAGALAYFLLPRRDIGAGVLPPRPGPARAVPALASPVALAWRLQRGAWLGWTVGMVTCGAVFGSIANGIGDLVGDSEQAQEIFERMGGPGGLVDAFLASLAGIYGMVVALYGVQATLRLRAEETSHHAEALLATPVGRLQWAASHLVFAFGGSAVILLAAGAATGVDPRPALGVAGSGDRRHARRRRRPDPGDVAGRGRRRHAVRSGAEAVGRRRGASPGLALAISMFGPVLDVPQIVLDLSPFSHVPKLPGAEVTATPLVLLCAAGALALLSGLGALRRRDIG